MRKWLVSLFLLYSVSASAQKNNTLVIAHVTVIDCTGAAAKPNSTVVLTGGLVSAVGPSGTVTVPTGVRVVEANGKFLIPGLWATHRSRWSFCGWTERGSVESTDPAYGERGSPGREPS